MSSKIITLNQLIGFYEQFVSAHLQLKSFGDGDFSEPSTTKQMEFPYLWVSHAPTSLSINRNKTQLPTVVLTFFVVDQHNNQENYANAVGDNSNNIREVHSDTHQMCLDVVNYSMTNLRKFGVMTPEQSVLISPLIDDTTDKAYGWFFDLELQLTHNNCAIPGDFDNVPAEPDICPPCPPCADALVENSDGTYSVNIASGGTLILPDEYITLNGGSFLTKPSVKNQDIELVNQDDDPIVPDDVTGNKITVTTGGGGDCNSLNNIKTGQVTSYAANDDGALQEGRDTDLYTLSWLNPAGNNNRFTDDAGGQIYTNMVYIDWTTYDQANDRVMGVCFASQQGLGSNDWATWMAGQPYTIAGYNDWYICNIRQAMHLMDFSDTEYYNYSPLNYRVTSGTTVIWSSTTRDGLSTLAWNVNTGALIRTNGKTIAYGTMFVRFYTLAELGL